MNAYYLTETEVTAWMDRAGWHRSNREAFLNVLGNAPTPYIVVKDPIDLPTEEGSIVKVTVRNPVFRTGASKGVWVILPTGEWRSSSGVVKSESEFKQFLATGSFDWEPLLTESQWKEKS